MVSAAKQRPPRLGQDGAAHELESGNDYATDSKIARAFKDGPWCWQHKQVIRFIRDCFDQEKNMTSALAVYVALTELASDHQSETFTSTIRQIASKAGTSYRTAISVLKRFERLGLVAIQRNIIADSHEKAASTYTLLRLGNHCIRLVNQNDFQLPISSEEREESNKVSHITRARAPELFEQLQKAVTGLTFEQAMERLEDMLPDRDLKRHRAEYETFCRSKQRKPRITGFLKRLAKSEPEWQPAKATTPKPNAAYQARLRQSEKEGRAELGITEDAST
jgi:hypothetical protein